jgi:hypothetical protein
LISSSFGLEIEAGLSVLALPHGDPPSPDPSAA